MGTANDLLRIVGLWYVSKNDVTGIYENGAAGTVQVALKTGKQWTRVLFAPGTGVINIKSISGERAGTYFLQQGQWQVGGKAIASYNDAALMVNDRYILKVEKPDGRMYIIGNTTFPVKIDYDLRTADEDLVFSFERKSLTGLLEMDEGVSGSGM